MERVLPIQPEQARRRVQLLLLLCGALVATTFGLWILPYRLDDAYITFRFAHWFARGDGLVFNSGAAPVEGFSSPLWFLGLSAVARIAGDGALPNAASLVGFASLLGCLWLACHFERDAPNPVFVALPIALLCTLPPAVYYAVTGLGTLLFLLAALVYVAALIGRAPLRLGLLAALLACWIRPEAPFLLVCQLGALWTAREPLGSRRSLWLAGGLLLGCGLLVAVRLLAVGTLLPNTFFAKPPVLGAGVRYLWDLFRTPWAAALIGLAVAGGLCGERHHRAALVAGVCWLGAPLLEGGDWMPVGRFALPALGLMCLASGGVGRAQGRKVVTRSGLVLGCAALAFNVAELRSLSALARSDLESVVHEQVYLARWLTRSGARSVALVDIGQIGYLDSPIDVVDLAGLTDARIARRPGSHLHKRGVALYVLAQRRPDVIVLRVRGAQPRDDERVLADVEGFALEPVERAIATDPRFARDYRLLFALLPQDMRNPYYGRVVYARADFVPRAQALPERRIVYLEPLRL